MKWGLVLLGTPAVLIALQGVIAIAGEDRLDLTAYRWKNRLLLVFSPSEEFPAFKEFMKHVSEQATGVSERHLLVFSIVNSGLSRMGERVLTPDEAESLRREFGVKGDAFRVVLIGKDGLVKLSQGVIKLTEIFAVIDSMPMRRQEMHQPGQVAE
ncbi:MAG: DUF4174 domain-containing protein [Deltaproteobacteria bacterium]|nr:DUF4174 domain-containing protein [Deltaproteobacteria bacterium]